jgi:hypothetical protein
MVLSVAVDADAAMLLSAIKRRLPAQAFDFGKAHGPADCILVLTLSDGAVLGDVGAFTGGKRQCISCSRRRLGAISYEPKPGGIIHLFQRDHHGVSPCRIRVGKLKIHAV